MFHVFTIVCIFRDDSGTANLNVSVGYCLFYELLYTFLCTRVYKMEHYFRFVFLLSTVVVDSLSWSSLTEHAWSLVTELPNWMLHTEGGEIQ